METLIRRTRNSHLAEHILALAKNSEGFLGPMQIVVWFGMRHGLKTNTNTISVTLNRLKKAGLMVNLGKGRWCYYKKVAYFKGALARERQGGRFKNRTAAARAARAKLRQAYEFERLLG